MVARLNSRRCFSRANWSLNNLQKINVHELYTRQRQSLRPWFEFFNTTKFKPPVNFRAGNTTDLLGPFSLSSQLFAD